ncbi:efflux RND transporter periplasmic adaptor subunit [Paenibacillus arenilitoris]|uniref:Efflux RND transporter periplasmic adaptor subunit n=1 Tax=Paenibacillus arenilitoris TaxID=2772299 RepID=A0A927CNI1_9BACL|nr:efflux RND transporter periplasmic adaptor subunit [Paenibacillus arenilitoris]MBD2869828.1 efflux RND transporter periplasmic adaptor subunit [Paenibacillus arenilitoris]
MKKKIKWAIIGLILIAVSFGLYRIGNPPRQTVIMNEAEQITFEVTKETLVNTIEVKGKSLYEQETPVYAPFSSEVTAWNATDGQQVTKGDVLFRLDRTAAQNEISQMEAALRKARLEAELNRYLSQASDELTPLASSDEERKKTLVEREAARLQSELNEVTADIQESELAQKKKKLREADFKSPATGIFLYESPGKRPQAVGENEYIGKVVDLKKLQFIALVGEQDVFRIKPDMPVQVKMNAMKDLELEGTVQKVSKFAKTGTDQNNLDQAAQFEIIIALEPNEHLIAGLSLNGAIETERKELAAVIPSIAIIREGGKHYAMADAGDGRFERKEIKIGLETPEKTEVTSGLKEGDRVALP